MRKHLVTGGAGFIGSHLVNRLISDGHRVVVLDNLSAGKIEYLSSCENNPLFEFRKRDILKDDITSDFKDVERVWHLAANSDVRVGEKNTSVHLNQNVIATYNVLEAMRKNNIKEIIFTSSSTVYGEEAIRPTPESYGPLQPTSLYGASKNSCESFISAYCHMFGMKSWIYRFANVIGPNSTHGVIFDFINKLRNDPSKLEILGNGKQEKSYIHIKDVVEAFLVGLKSKDSVNIFNVGSDDTIDVIGIADIVSELMGIKPEYYFTGGDRGWKGDVPKMQLATEKLKEIGWRPMMKSSEAVRETIKALI